MPNASAKRAARIILFGPLFVVAFTGLLLMAPFFMVADWALSKTPYHPRQTIAGLLAIMGESLQDLWSGEM